MATQRKPVLFVGSSAESRNVAFAVQENLERDAEVVVWTQGVFELSLTTIESLCRVLSGADFGAFVLTPDDVLKMRDRRLRVVRDNVIFELGMFVGGLGRERSFLVLPEGTKLHLPSDLAGITGALFDAAKLQTNPVAALGTACNQIRRAMQDKACKVTHRTSERAIASMKLHDGRVPVSKTIEMLRSASHQVSITGSSLRSFTGYLERVPTSEFKQHLIQLLERGVNFQFNFLDPDSNIAKIYARDRNENLIQEIRASIAELQRFVKDIRPHRQKLNISLYNRLPIGYLLLIDPELQTGRGLIASYFPGTTRADSPYLELYKSDHPLAFQKYLNAVSILCQPRLTRNYVSKQQQVQD